MWNWVGIKSKGKRDYKNWLGPLLSFFLFYKKLKLGLVLEWFKELELDQFLFEKIHFQFQFRARGDE
jgi:hypothetical protein